MKKRLLIGIPAIALFGLAVGFSVKTSVPVFAEDEVVETKAEEIKTEEEMTEKIKAWLSKYLDGQMVANIITWATTGGLMTALFTVYVKYRKYKSTTIEDLVKLVKSEVGKYLKEAFGDLDKELVTKLINSFNVVDDKLNTVLQALVLAQDKTAEGKIALLKLISDISDNEEVKEVASEVIEKVEEEKKKEDAVKETVKDEYVPVE